MHICNFDHNLVDFLPPRSASQASDYVVLHTWPPFLTFTISTIWSFKLLRATSTWQPLQYAHKSEKKLYSKYIWTTFVYFYVCMYVCSCMISNVYRRSCCCHTWHITCILTSVVDTWHLLSLSHLPTIIQNYAMSTQCLSIVSLLLRIPQSSTVLVWQVWKGRGSEFIIALEPQLCEDLIYRCKSLCILLSWQLLELEIMDWVEGK